MSCQIFVAPTGEVDTPVFDPINWNPVKKKDADPPSPPPPPVDPRSLAGIRPARGIGSGTADSNPDIPLPEPPNLAVFAGLSTLPKTVASSLETSQRLAPLLAGMSPPDSLAMSARAGQPALPQTIQPVSRQISAPILSTTVGGMADSYKPQQAITSDCGCGGKVSPTPLRGMTFTDVPQSWYDLPISTPRDPRKLILNASLGATQGVFLRSTTFASPVGSWSPSPLTLAGNPTCTTLGLDNQYLKALAAQWNFLHLAKSPNANISPLLANVIYVKSGEKFAMLIPLTSGTTVLNDVQLSYRDNAATSGSFIGGATGGIPVISFTGSFSGVQQLTLTFSSPGYVQLALRTIDSMGNYAMFGLECVITK